MARLIDVEPHRRLPALIPQVSPPAVAEDHRLTDLLNELAMEMRVGHSGPVSAMALSRNGNFIVSGSEDRTVKVWNTSNGQLLQSLEGHKSEVAFVSLTGAEDVLFSGTRYGDVMVWDLNSGNPLLTFKVGVQLVDDGLVSAAGDLLVVWGSVWHSKEMFGLLQVFDGRTTQLLYEFETGRMSHYPGVALSTDSSILAICERTSSSIVLRNARNGKLLRILRGHTNGVTAVSISMRNSIGASGTARGLVRLWRPHDGHLIRTLKVGTEFISTLCFSGNEQRLAVVCGSEASTWNIETGQRLAIWPVKTYTHAYRWARIGLSYNGRVAAMSLGPTRSNEISFWKAQTGQLIRSVGFHAKSVSSAILSDDGNSLVTHNPGEPLSVWNTRSGSRVSTCHVAGMGMPDEDGSDGFQLVGLLGQNIIGCFAGFGKNVAQFRDVRGNQSLAACSANIEPDIVHNLLHSDGHLDSRILSVMIALPHRASFILETTNPNTGEILPVCVSRCGNNFVVGCEQQLRLWDLSQSRVLGEIDAVGRIKSVACGKSDIVAFTCDDAVHIVSRATGRPRHVLLGHTSVVSSVSISEDEQIVASGSFDGTVRLWSGVNGRAIAVFISHHGDGWLTYVPSGYFIGSERMMSLALRMFKKADMQFDYRLFHRENPNPSKVIEALNRVFLATAHRGDGLLRLEGGVQRQLGSGE